MDMTADFFSPDIKQTDKLNISWEISGLKPDPVEEWNRLQKFLGFDEKDRAAMLHSVEPLFKRGHELVVGNYDYLLQNPETAAILGWDQGADPVHLAERRRFFTVWLARTLGMDFSEDFARYLFRAGQLHAAHGPRHTHVPEVYVTGAISLVNATFARFLQEEMPGDVHIPAAFAGWNKTLSLHLHMMLIGFQSAQELDRGDFQVNVSFFARLRKLVGRQQLGITLSNGERLEQAMRKLFNYYPHLRREIFDPTWIEGERLDATGTPWLEVHPAYRVKSGWRLLLNGKDTAYHGGLEIRLKTGDQIDFFPPGR